MSIAKETAFEQEFEQAQKDWAANCSGVDEVLGELSDKHHGSFSKFVMDTPSRVVYWKDGGREYAISFLLTPKSNALKTWATSWQDKGNSLLFYALKDGELATPVNRDEFKETVDKLVYDISTSSRTIRRIPLRNPRGS